MAKKERIKAPTGITPVGTWKWPKLSEPDYGTKDYPKPDGEFSVKHVVKQDDERVKLFIAQWQPLHDAAIARAEEEFTALPVATRKKLGNITINPLFTVIYDEATEQPTGEIEFKFAMKYSGTYKTGPKAGKKWTRTPAIFDAHGNKMVKAPAIWGGTTGRVSFEVGMNKEGLPGYFIPATGAAGLSLRLQAVRVLDLVTGGQKSAKEYGFDEAEDGYVFDPTTAASGDDEEDAAPKASAGGVVENNPDF